MDINVLLRLARAGESTGKIAQILELNRRTVMRYRRWFGEQGLMEGDLPDPATLHQLIATTLPTAKPPQQISLVGPYRAEIAQMRQTLTPLERSLFTRYVAFTGFSNWHDTVWHTAVDEQSGGNQSGRQRFPLVVISRYLQTGADVAIEGDLSDVVGRQNLPFATIQQSLQKGRAQGTASPSLITDYNAEANLLTAFICHADGLMPAKVCHRAVIKSILKHVK